MANRPWVLKSMRTDCAPYLAAGYSFYKSKAEGFSTEDSLIFAGYMADRLAQCGGFGGGEDAVASYCLRAWNASLRTGFRFRTGRNRDNYLKAGRLWLIRHLRKYTARYGMEPDTPVGVLYDRMVEECDPDAREVAYLR